jgi:uncharacterized membrane protein
MSSHRPPARRFVRAASVLLRAVAMCLALSLSGAVHFALDLWLDGDAAAQHFSGCADDGDEDCPPGCASCHCVHASALPAPLDGVAPSTLLPAFEVAWSPYERGAPPRLVPLPVYRPPRV